MKKLLTILMLFTLCSCSSRVDPEPILDDDTPTIKDEYADYGAFLGRSENNIKGFELYNYVSIDFEEYDINTINKIKALPCDDVFGYLNVGSVENYRSYFKRFEDITFLDYENWPDERWIDVSNEEWQDFIVNTLAKEIKDKGGTGVYMDNVDVYSICIEENRPTTDVIKGLKNIIKGVANLGLKVMMNGGAEFLDDMNDKKDSIFDYIWGYHQEEVFSLIDDYEENIFAKQEKEDSNYYKEIASIMKKKGKEVFLLEYTKDATLISKIREYCVTNNFHYYISSSINLD